LNAGAASDGGPKGIPEGRDACVTRMARDGHPGLARSTDCVAQWAEGRVTALRGVSLFLSTPGYFAAAISASTAPADWAGNGTPAAA